MTPTLRQYDVGLLEFGVALSESMMLPPHFESLIYRGHGMPSCFGQVRHLGPLCTGRIQILVLTNCQAISTEIGTDSLKI